MSDFIKIISRPIGPAPDWVRDAWIGINLPTKDARRLRTFAFLTFPATFWEAFRHIALGRVAMRSGYRVHAADAILILAKTQPEAAQWWQENASNTIANGKYFLFDAESCQSVREE